MLESCWRQAPLCTCLILHSDPGNRTWLSTSDWVESSLCSSISQQKAFCPCASTVARLWRVKTNISGESNACYWRWRVVLGSRERALGAGLWELARVLLLPALVAWVLLAVILQTAGQCCDIVSPCCYRNRWVCRLAVRAESSWQTESKAGCLASHPRLVLAQRGDPASPGVRTDNPPAAVPWSGSGLGR